MSLETKAVRYVFDFMSKMRYVNEGEKDKVYLRYGKEAVVGV